MIADLKPYAEYKESGLMWLGQVPGHWETRRLRHACDMRVSNVDKHMKPGETPVRLCNYVEVYKNERIRESTRFMQASASEDERIRFGLRKGDVLITKDSEQWNDIGVPALVEFEAPDVVCGYHLAILRSRPGLHGSFLHRALESHFIAAQFHVEANGVTRYGLSHGAIQGVAIPLPPPAEQAAIVRFLDWANGRLERAIRAKRKVIALLNEQKQAIIHRAVTRGLDPSVPLKPSGIPWLDDIPQHWEVMRTKLLAHIKTGGRDTVDRIDSAPYPFFVRSQTVERIDTYSFDGEAVLTAGDGAGVAKVFHYIDGKFDYHQRVYKFSNFRRVSGQFFFLYLKSTLRFEALDASAKSTVDSLRLPLLQNFPTLVPPSEEQLAIVRAVETETGGLDTAISRVAREIELLREYRTRLVADVVTGKLDVREAAARLPDEAAPDIDDNDTDLSLDLEAADEETAV